MSIVQNKLLWLAMGVALIVGSTIVSRSIPSPCEKERWQPPSMLTNAFFSAAEREYDAVMASVESPLPVEDRSVDTLVAAMSEAGRMSGYELAMLDRASRDVAAEFHQAGAFDTRSLPSVSAIDERVALLERVLEAQERVLEQPEADLDRFDEVLRTRNAEDRQEAIDAMRAIIEDSPNVERRDLEAQVTRAGIGMLAVLRERFGAWTPHPLDGEPIFSGEEDLAAYNTYAMRLDTLLQRLNARG